MVIQPGAHAVAWCRPGRIPAVTSYLLGPFTGAVFQARPRRGGQYGCQPVIVNVLAPDLEGANFRLPE